MQNEFRKYEAGYVSKITKNSFNLKFIPSVWHLSAQHIHTGEIVAGWLI